MDKLERNQRLALRIAGLVAVLSFLVSIPLIVDAGFGAEDFLIEPREQQSWGDAVRGYFTGPDPEADHYWRPATRVVQQSLQFVFGTSSYVFHAWNIVLHLLGTALFWVLARRLTENDVVAWIATSIFLIHPAHEEPVIWVSGISGLSDSVCHLAGLVVFDRFLRERGVRSGIAVTVLFILAVLFKESGTTMLLTLPLLWWYHGHDRRQIWPIVSMAVAAIGIWQWRASIGVDSLQSLTSVMMNPIGWMRNLLFYVVQSIAPVRSIFRVVGFDNFYRVRDALPTIPNSLPYLIAVITLGVGALGAIVYSWRSWSRYSKLCLLLALASLGPLLASRYTGMRLVYLFCGFAALCLIGLAISGRRRFMPITLAAWIIFMSIAWVERSQAWRESGHLAGLIFDKAKEVVKGVPSDATIVFREIPDRHLGGFVFHMAFSEALMKQLGTNSPKIRNYDDPHEDNSGIPANAIWYRWDGSQFVAFNGP